MKWRGFNFNLKLKKGKKGRLKERKELNPFTQSLLLLVATTFGIFITAIGGSFAYEKVLKPEESLPDHTMVGTVPVGELKISEAVEKISQHIEDWKRLAIVDLYFFDEKVLLLSDTIRFDPETIVQQAKNDGYANFSPNVSLAAIEEVIREFTYPNVSSNVNLQLVKEEIEMQLKALNTNSVSLDINEFLDGGARIENSVVAVVNMNASNAKGYFSTWATALDGITIEANKVFSLFQALEDNGVLLTKGEEINVIASSMYQLFMQTNFQLVERHISRTPPSYIPLGYDAMVAPSSADLKFFNPNFYSYELRSSFENNTLTVSLHGKPFLFSYEILVEEEQVIEPRTVVQFSSKRQIDDVQMIRNGRNGYLVSVYQTVWGVNGEFVEKMKVAEDFYPPVHRVEERSLYVEPLEDEFFFDIDWPSFDNEGEETEPEPEPGNETDL